VKRSSDALLVLCDRNCMSNETERGNSLGGISLHDAITDLLCDPSHAF